MSGVTPSPELLAVARRWIDAIPNRRPRELRNLMSEGDHLRFIGTAEDEIWAGAAVRDGVGGFFGVVPDLIRHDEILAEAFENGETGWANLVHQLVFETHPDQTYIVRSTLIFALEDGVWKIVLRHGSVPIPNQDFTGMEQTAIADLTAAARQGFALDQREGFASIMFTDMVNSSRLAELMGDRLWSAEIARHFATLRGIIEDHGGQFVKSLGDGTMSSFPSADRALHAARAIMGAVARSDGPAIALRIGIHTGEVVQSEDDFFGSVVNKAARIAASASAEEVRVSDATRGMAGDASELCFSEAVTATLKGFDGDHLIHKLEWRE